MTEEKLDVQDTAGEDVELDESKANSVGEEVQKQEEVNDAKTFTQDEINEMIQKRLERERKKFEDYEEVKKKATQFEKQLEEQKRREMSEAERLQSDLEEAKQLAEKRREEAEHARKEAEELRIKTEFDLAARNAGIKYVEDAYGLAKLSGAELGVSDDGKVEGLEEVINTLVSEKPYLLDMARPIGKPTAKAQEEPQVDREELLKEARELAEKGGPKERVEYLALRRKLGLNE